VADNIQNVISLLSFKLAATSGDPPRRLGATNFYLEKETFLVRIATEIMIAFLISLEGSLVSLKSSSAISPCQSGSTTEGGFAGAANMKAPIQQNDIEECH